MGGCYAATGRTLFPRIEENLDMTRKAVVVGPLAVAIVAVAGVSYTLARYGVIFARSSAMQPAIRNGTMNAAGLSQEPGLALGAQPGEARMRAIFTAAGFTRFRRATETPFNLVYEARA
jgi:hypothetical protein